VIGVSSLQRCVEHLNGSAPIAPAVAGTTQAVEDLADMSEVRGQEQAKRALEIAAAGGHNVLMLGPPGSGKTMLARAFSSLLPDLDRAESLEVAALYSLRGALRERPPTATRPPYRAPHHSVSRAGLIGGGTGLARPGEISLAHGGVPGLHARQPRSCRAEPGDRRQGRWERLRRRAGRQADREVRSRLDPAPERVD
jgi:magnesium chelatase family protein